MYPLKTQQSGTALIITVGLLAVLAVIGFGFAVLARLQHDISGCYRAAAQNELIAQAALQYAIGEIRWGWGHAPLDDNWNPILPPGSIATFQTGAVADPTDGPHDPWFVDPTIASQGYVGSDNRNHYCNLRCNSYALIHDDLGARLGVSNIKVLDSAGKLNINDQDGPIDGVGTPNTTRLRGVLKQLLLRLPLGLSDAQATTLATNILNARNTLPDKRFSSLEQLAARNTDGSFKISGMDPRLFEILKHYLTIYSWPHQLPVVNSFPYVVNSTGSGSLDRKSSSHSSTPKQYYYRSPININTAGWELLYAVLMNISVGGSGPALSTNDADEVAKWIVLKRNGKYNPDCIVPGTALAAGDKSLWDSWTGTSSQTRYRDSLERRFEGWCAYPVGPFDSWGEVADFLYSMVRPDDANSDPFPKRLTGAKAEAVLAGISPNTFAAGLAGYNTWHLGYPHLKQDPTVSTGREQFARDRDVSADVPAPEVVGKHMMTAGGEGYPFCFSSLGRHEVYARTYTFLKAQQGTVTAATANTLTDSTQVWLSSPSQWRGYTVVIYEGKGKGQMRGIVYVKDDGTPNDGKGSTLVVDRWSIVPDTTSRYYIVGPGALRDSQVTGSSGVTTPPDAGNRYYVLTDTAAKWEKGQWNGHRVLIYRCTVAGGVETVIDQSIQERTIIETVKGSSSGTLIVAPDLDPNLLTGGSTTAYLILGCDGMVEHSGAFKAYDVIHHTTQRDFEEGRLTSASSGYTLAATGPNHYLKRDGTTLATAPSDIDGWISARKRDVVVPSGAGNPLVHNFNKPNLEPDEGGTCEASTTPPKSSWAANDVLSGGSALLYDGAHLANPGHYIDLRLASHLSTEGNEGQEGGFVSLWIRPDEAFFSGNHKIVQIFGRTQDNEEIALRVDDGVLKLSITFRTPGIAFKQVIDTKYGPRMVCYNFGDYITRTYTGPNIRSGPKPWRPGEWHHIAFAWFELYDKDATGIDDDGDNTSNSLDDKVVGSPNQDTGRLDSEVGCALRMWVDGADQGKTTDQAAFNFASASPPAPMVRLSGDARATVDGLIVFRHTDKELNFTVPPGAVRYDAYESYDQNGVPTGAERQAEYVSRSIPVPSGGNDKLILGTVAWTGFFPWMKPEDRWGGPGGTTNNFPIRVEVSFAGKTSEVLPKNNPPATQPMPAVFTGGALRQASGALIDGTSGSIQYKVYLYPCQGTDVAENEPGTLKGRQTPVLEDITITVLGPVVYYYWK